MYKKWPVTVPKEFPISVFSAHNQNAINAYEISHNSGTTVKALCIQLKLSDSGTYFWPYKDTVCVSACIEDHKNV